MTTRLVTDAEIDNLVDRLEQVSVNALESALRRDGSVQPPMVHMVVETHPGGYVGFLESRPFLQGADAALGIRQMGILPAAMYATRLMVTWEHVDLCVALGSGFAGSGIPNAQIVVDARRDGSHTMRVHPFEVIVLNTQDPLMSPVLPKWGLAERVENGRLPEPVEELLVLWREGFNPRQLGAIYEQMVQSGYVVQLYTMREHSAHSSSL